MFLQLKPIRRGKVDAKVVAVRSLIAPWRHQAFHARTSAIETDAAVGRHAR